MSLRCKFDFYSLQTSLYLIFIETFAYIVIKDRCCFNLKWLLLSFYYYSEKDLSESNVNKSLLLLTWLETIISENDRLSFLYYVEIIYKNQVNL